MKKRIFIFITGQYRKFWNSWNNLVEKIMKPNQEEYDIYVCLGMDKIWRSTGHVWCDMDREIFQTHLRNEWILLGYPIENLILEWIDHSDPYFHNAISSLKKYLDNGKLDIYWYNYLIHRSGSCIEYVQILRMYDLVCSQYKIRDDDLMMRTRADILLRHSFDFHFLPDKLLPTKVIFQNLLPTCSHFDHFEEQDDRESSILPQEFIKDRWIITLRKNLVYIMPLKAGSFLSKIVKNYGDWDTPETNNYWFNAESQFRGCFRNNQFTLWEYSQIKDECYGEFETQENDFPIYAIYR